MQRIVREDYRIWDKAKGRLNALMHNRDNGGVEKVPSVVFGRICSDEAI